MTVRRAVKEGRCFATWEMVLLSSTALDIGPYHNVTVHKLRTSLSYSAVKAKKLRRGVVHGAFTPLEVLSGTSFLPLDTPQPQPITYLFLSRSACSDSFVKIMKFARAGEQLPLYA